MSRIYEALARANDVVAAPQQTASERRPVAALERYAAERPLAITHGPVARPVAPLPSVVPALPLDNRYPSISPTADFEGKVIGGGTADVVSAEQYADLATVLHETQLDRGLRMLLVTSATPREGKTLTVVNLAITLSSSYARRVLIVDADLRRPSVHRALGLAADRGLSDALWRPTSELPIIDVSPQLSVLPAGRPDPNPLARLSQDRLQPVFTECASRFDWVLVDTPPLGIGADAQLLARFVQGVIFVIRAGAAPYTVVERALDQLGRECIIGTVLNGIDERAVPATSPYGRFASAG
jgi:protein-tyrosine kinase